MADCLLSCGCTHAGLSHIFSGVSSLRHSFSAFPKKYVQWRVGAHRVDGELRGEAGAPAEWASHRQQAVTGRLRGCVRQHALQHVHLQYLSAHQPRFLMCPCNVILLQERLLLLFCHVSNQQQGMGPIAH